MLKKISISNFAIIDSLEVSFLDGMTSVTGETGAGKSIILDALSLVLGKRADLNYLKDSSVKCIIEASFDISNYNLKGFFTSEDLDYYEETILRRELIPSGKSRSFINDTPVTLDLLNRISSSLIDFHSQNETLKLFSNFFQFKFLDSLSENTNYLKEYRAQYLEFNSLTNSLKNLIKTKDSSVKELDYQKFLFQELDSLRLEEDTLSKIKLEVAELSNVSEFKDKLSASIKLLNSDEEGILTRLSDVLNNIKSIQRFSVKFKEYNFRIESLDTELKDILFDFENISETLEYNPALLNDKNLELDNIYSILKKHNVSSVEELILIKNDL